MELVGNWGLGSRNPGSTHHQPSGIFRGLFKRCVLGGVLKEGTLSGGREGHRGAVQCPFRVSGGVGPSTSSTWTVGKAQRVKCSSLNLARAGGSVHLGTDWVFGFWGFFGKEGRSRRINCRDLLM